MLNSGPPCVKDLPESHLSSDQKYIILPIQCRSGTDVPLLPIAAVKRSLPILHINKHNNFSALDFLLFLSQLGKKNWNVKWKISFTAAVRISLN